VKKLVLVLISLFFAVSVYAEVDVPDLISKLPALNQAVIFSLDKNEFDYATTITVAEFKERLKLDIGYTPEKELLALLSVKLVAVKDYLTFPVLDLIEIEPFVYVGLDRIAIGLGNAKDNNEIDYGLGVKVLSIKF